MFGEAGYRTIERSSPRFEADIHEVAGAGRMRVVAVTEHGDVDQVRRRRVLPYLAIHAGEVDLLVE
jgi:hypothetical protein